MKPPASFLLRALTLVLALTGASAMGVLWYADHSAGAQVLTRLKTAATAEAQLQDQRMTVLRLRADALALDPAFVDYVAQSLIPNPAQGNEIDSTSITDLLIERRHGYDLAAVLDPQGKPVAHSGTPLDKHDRIQRDPLVQRVLQTLKPAQGVWLDDGRLVLVVVEPLLRSGALQGLLLAAERLDDGFASAVGRLSRSGIVISGSPTPGTGAITSRGLDPSVVRALATHATILRSAQNSRGRELRLSEDGHAALAWVTLLPTAGGHATLMAVDQNFGSQTPVIAKVWPLWLGVGLLGAIAVVFVLMHWRRVEIPLGRMTEIIERGKHGDRSLVIRVDGSPSVVHLRDAINRLMAQDQSGR